MMTHVCPRLLNLNNDFVLLRFWARASEDLSAIEVIYIIIIIIKELVSKLDGHKPHPPTWFSTSCILKNLLVNYRWP